MIDMALQRLGKKRCPECKKIIERESNACTNCGKSFVKTSTPEDGI